MALAECYFAVGGDSADDLASSSPSTPGGVGAAVKKTSPINLGSLVGMGVQGCWTLVGRLAGCLITRRYRPC
jgi:hypothetical protein